MFWELLLFFLFEVNLLNKCYDPFKNFIKFWSSERNTENEMSHLYFNKENDYSVENTNENEDLHSTILYSFQFEPKQKKNRW